MRSLKLGNVEPLVDFKDVLAWKYPRVWIYSSFGPCSDPDVLFYFAFRSGTYMSVLAVIGFH